MNFHLALLLAYAVALVALGLAIGRRVRTAGAFFVAGHGLGPGLLFATILAANIGAGSTVGAAGLGYRDGLGAWWWVGSAGIGTLVLATWVGPRIWRIARDHELLTAGDFLEWRYGPSVRAVVTATLWLGTLAILAGQLIAIAWVLNAVAGIPKVWGCLIGGLAMTTYFTAGGLLTSAWVNLVQLVVLLAGFALALPWALDAVGGWAAVRASAPSGDYLGFLGSGPSGPVYLALLGPAFVVSPGLLQKVYGARSARAVRIGVGASGVALLVFAALPPMLGMIARVAEPGLAHRELAMPHLLTVALPLLLGSLGLAAIFSAEVSSADAILFMLSTSLSEDLYRRFLAPEADDDAVLRVARRAAVAGGLAGIALAVVLPGVITSLTIFYALLSVSLFMPVVGGLFVGRAGTRDALAAIAAGVSTLLIATVAGTSGWLHPTVLGGVASAVAFFGSVSLRLALRPQQPPAVD